MGTLDWPQPQPTSKDGVHEAPSQPPAPSWKAPTRPGLAQRKESPQQSGSRGGVTAKGPATSGPSHGPQLKWGLKQGPSPPRSGPCRPAGPPKPKRGQWLPKRAEAGRQEVGEPGERAQSPGGLPKVRTGQDRKPPRGASGGVGLCLNLKWLRLVQSSPIIPASPAP